jgi:hypothetical protein
MSDRELCRSHCVLERNCRLGTNFRKLRTQAEFYFYNWTCYLNFSALFSAVRPVRIQDWPLRTSYYIPDHRVPYLRTGIRMRRKNSREEAIAILEKEKWNDMDRRIWKWIKIIHSRSIFPLPSALSSRIFSSVLLFYCNLKPPLRRRNAHMKFPLKATPQR